MEHVDAEAPTVPAPAGARRREIEVDVEAAAAVVEAYRSTSGGVEGTRLPSLVTGGFRIHEVAPGAVYHVDRTLWGPSSPADDAPAAPPRTCDARRTDARYRVEVRGRSAWVWVHGPGPVHGHEVELYVLVRRGGAWRIESIQRPSPFESPR